jgi:hypothetical protein
MSSIALRAEEWRGQRKRAAAEVSLSPFQILYLAKQGWWPQANYLQRGGSPAVQQAVGRRRVVGGLYRTWV